MEYYHSDIKKNEICNNMDEPEGVMLSKISQRKTDIACFHLDVESKKQINEHNKTETDCQTEQTSGHQREEGWREGQDAGRGLRGTNY